MDQFNIFTISTNLSSYSNILHVLSPFRHILFSPVINVERDFFVGCHFCQFRAPLLERVLPISHYNLFSNHYTGLNSRISPLLHSWMLFVDHLKHKAAGRTPS